MNELTQIDPQWAWQPFEPTAENPWNRRLAAHLFRRATFGATSEELDEAVAAGPQAAVSRLVTVAGPQAEAFEREADDLAQAVLATGKSENLAPWWLHRMLASPQPLIEKMTLFWHGHFASSAAKVNDASLMYAQNRTLRQGALGPFADLVNAISRDPAMLIYLDSATNRKAHANENYARELMELFCLGEGNYSEKDVQELARTFTGWEIKQGRFRFNRFQHDTGMKRFLDREGPFGGEEAVAIVLEQRCLPQFLVQKLLRFFVCDEPPLPDALVEPLAREFRESGLRCGALVERILRSNLFFSPLMRGRKIKSPVELLVGFLRSLSGRTDLYRLADDLKELGHAIFYPPNVKGWDGGRAWINSSTLLARDNALYRLLHDPNTRFGQRRLADYLAAWSTEPAEILSRLEELLFALPLGSAIGQPLQALLAEGASQRDDKWSVALHVLCTLPEFQFA